MAATESGVYMSALTYKCLQGRMNDVLFGDENLFYPSIGTSLHINGVTLCSRHGNQAEQADCGTEG